MLDLLWGAGRLFEDPQELGPMIDQLLAGLEDLLDAERSTILLLRRDRESGTRRLVLRQERARNEAIGWPAVPPGEVRSLLRPGTAGGEPAIGEVGGRPAAVASLLDSGRLVGALCVESSKVAEWSPLRRRVLGLVGRMGGAAIGNARRLREHVELERLRAGLLEAKAIQERLLPRWLPEVEGYELAAFCKSCLEVGGDLHDVEVARGRLHLVIGDVRGKGPGAGLLMAEILGALRVMRALDVPLERQVGAVDEQLLRWAARSEYATLFVSTLDPTTHRFDFVSAGHPPAYVICPGGERKELAATGPPVGLLPDHEVPFERASLRLPRGCTLVLYTDGLTEAELGSEEGSQAREPESLGEEAREMFGEARMGLVLDGCSGESAQGTVDRLCRAVDEHRGRSERADDITLLVLCRTGG